MAFYDIVFPKTIAEGARGGRNWNTDIVRNRGGYEKANQNWPVPLGAWEVGQVNRTLAETRRLQSFFHVVKGKLHGFRFRDPKDAMMNRVTASRLTSTTYQMRQLFYFGGHSFYLKVQKPEMNDVSLVVTLGSGETTDYTVDTSTGIITLGGAVNSNVDVRVTGGYHIPVRFDIDEFNPEQVDQGYWSWPSIRIVEVRLA